MKFHYKYDTKSEQILDTDLGVIWRLVDNGARFNSNYTYELYCFSVTECMSEKIVARDDIALNIFNKMKLDVNRDNHL